MPVAHFIRLLLNTGKLTFSAHPTYAHYNTTPLPRKPGNRWLLGAGIAAGAIVLVAILASHARAITPDQEAAWLNRLAKDGDAGAQLQLGLAYREGRYGLTPDKKTGLYWITQAARNGEGYAASLVSTTDAKSRSTTHEMPTAENANRLTVTPIGSPTPETCAALCGAALNRSADGPSAMNTRTAAGND